MKTGEGEPKETVDLDKNSSKDWGGDKKVSESKKEKLISRDR